MPARSRATFAILPKTTLHDPQSVSLQVPTSLCSATRSDRQHLARRTQRLRISVRTHSLHDASLRSGLALSRPRTRLLSKGSAVDQAKGLCQHSYRKRLNRRYTVALPTGAGCSSISRGVLTSPQGMHDANRARQDFAQGRKSIPRTKPHSLSPLFLSGCSFGRSHRRKETGSLRVSAGVKLPWFRRIARTCQLFQRLQRPAQANGLSRCMLTVPTSRGCILCST